ncbi:hypothetical protein GCM10029964_086180 [Kibdelosporangium lantanae]
MAWETVELQGYTGLPVRPVAINNRGTVIGNGRLAAYMETVRWDRDGKFVQLQFDSEFSRTQAQAINDDDTAVGSAAAQSGEERAARWGADGGLTLLQSLPDSNHSWASAINMRGEIVGGALTREYVTVPVRWDHGGNVTVLETPSGMWSGRATGINDNGVVIGEVVGPDSQTHHAARWDEHGHVKVLDALPNGSWSQADHVDKTGVVAGASDDGTGQSYAVRWDRNGHVIKLDTLGGSYGAVKDMNRNGVMTGNAANTMGSDRAVRWSPRGHIQELPMHGDAYRSNAVAINSRGTVLGMIFSGGGMASIALWWRDGRAVTLPISTDNASVSPVDINDVDSVLVTSLIDGSRTHNTVWRPHPST